MFSMIMSVKDCHTIAGTPHFVKGKMYGILWLLLPWNLNSEIFPYFWFFWGLYEIFPLFLTFGPSPFAFQAGCCHDRWEL